MNNGSKTDIVSSIKMVDCNKQFNSAETNSDNENDSIKSPGYLAFCNT